MPEGICPYEVSANWACLDGDFAPTTVLAKDGKPLGEICVSSIVVTKLHAHPGCFKHIV